MAFLWAGSSMSKSFLYWSAQTCTHRFRCGINKCQVERKDHLLSPGGFVLPNANQEAVGHLCCEGSLSVYCPPGPPILLHQPAFWPVGTQPLLMHVVFLPSARPCTFPFVEINKIPLGPVLQLNEVPLNSSTTVLLRDVRSSHHL